MLCWDSDDENRVDPSFFKQVKAIKKNCKTFFDVSHSCSFLKHNVKMQIQDAPCLSGSDGHEKQQNVDMSMIVLALFDRDAFRIWMNGSAGGGRGGQGCRGWCWLRFGSLCLDSLKASGFLQQDVSDKGRPAVLSGLSLMNHILRGMRRKQNMRLNKIISCFHNCT